MILKKTSDKIVMTDKNGTWFFELILNILLLSGVAFVTFAARSEQERGITVPLLAAVSGGSQSVASSVDSVKNQIKPALTPNLTLVTPNPLPSAVLPAVNGLTFQQAWGSLEIWAAGLDGKITPEELTRITNSIQNGWTGPQSARDYLKNVNDQINQGKADEVVKNAVKTISTQSIEKKNQVITSVTQFMKDNGVSLDKIKQVIGQWMASF